MSLNSLTAISPIDGRYHYKTHALTDYFSESALMKYRVQVEIEYFIALCNLPLKQLIKFPKDKFEEIRKLYKDFSSKDAKRIKEIEELINHDVKSIEYFIKEKFEKLNLNNFQEFIHFGLTSQDINNTAIPLSVKEAYTNIFSRELNKIVKKLNMLSRQWENIPMLARTHGQAASPTRLGKEMGVFMERIEKQILLIKDIDFSAKFGGASGNLNAHHVTYPKIDWKKFANNFVSSLGLIRQQKTTQIEHYDNLAAFLDNIKRINTILIDLSIDIWIYVSMDYFKQSIKKGEVGSSAMPHKVNPIDFENAEGNLKMSSAILDFISSELPVSRLQRDLTDSTILRNLGVPFSHSLIGFSSLQKGLEKLVVNHQKIESDLNNNWVVISEAIQTILRREGYQTPYELLKDLTRTNENINKEEMLKFIDNLDIKEKVKKELKEITPFNYTGI